MPRQTNDIHILGDFKGIDIEAFCSDLAEEFYAEAVAVSAALRTGRPFNAIHAKGVFKFGIFPAGDDEFAQSELARRCLLLSPLPGLEDIAFPISSVEDTVLAKLVWYRKGGEVSERQWSDVQSILRVQASRLDVAYLEEWGRKLDVSGLLERAQREAG